MPSVPIVERKVNTNALPAPSYGTRLQNVPGQMFQVSDGGAGELTKGLSDASNAMFKVEMHEKEKADAVNLLAAQDKLNSWVNDSLWNKDTGAFSKKGKDALTLSDQIFPQYNKLAKEIRDGLTNDDQRAAFDRYAIPGARDFQEKLLRHAMQENENYQSGMFKSSVENAKTNASLYFDDSKRVEQEIVNARNTILAQSKLNGWSAAQTEEGVRKAQAEAFKGAFNSMLDRNPMGAKSIYDKYAPDLDAETADAARNALKPAVTKHEGNRIANKILSSKAPPLNQDAVINWVIDNSEGTKLVPDGDGQAIYGINSKWNPELFKDGKIPTREEAVQAYKDKYWERDGIKLDDLPANMKLVAFDGMVNHREGFMGEAIKEADGDPRKLIELRAKEYQRLAQENPEKYGKELNGWMNRLSRLSEQINVQRGQLPDLAEMKKQIALESEDPDVQAAAEKSISDTYEQIKKDRSERENQSFIEAMNYKHSGKPVPDSIMGQLWNLSPEKAQKVEDYTGATDQSTYYSLYSMPVEQFSEIDLRNYADRLSSSDFKEMVKRQDEMRKDPAKKGEGRTRQQIITDTIDALFPQKGDADKRRLASAKMARAFDEEVAAYRASSGKNPSPIDMQRIADGLVLKTHKKDAGWFGGDTRRYDAGDYKIDGISDEVVLSGGKRVPARFVIDGQNLSYNEMIGRIVTDARFKGLQVSDETISEIYKNAKNAGVIQVVTYDR